MISAWGICAVFELIKIFTQGCSGGSFDGKSVTQPTHNPRTQSAGMSWKWNPFGKKKKVVCLVSSFPHSKRVTFAFAFSICTFHLSSQAAHKDTRIHGLISHGLL